ncbi:hypothetical protein BBJ28_00000519 [Nothophytophthora sp. Chile5]|nr:hypothetical protein BBJ28_00000519 [Nothophytophthora sp. Chile5]
MGQSEKGGIFTFAFVDKFKAKHHERRARRREAKLLRQSMGRRSLFQRDHDERSKHEHQEKPPHWNRHSLQHESQRRRSISKTHDTSLHRHTLHEHPGAASIKADAFSRLATAHATPKPKRSLDETLHFSFSGGGWLMVYMYGVCKALQEQKLEENSKFIGTSAGCLSIVSLVLGSDFDEICDSVINSYVPAAHGSWKGPFNMREYLVDAITRHANTDNIHKLEGKVTVVYTSLSAWASRRVSHFKNPVHMLHTMVASCCATPLVGMPFEHEGEYVIDGGLLDNQPLFEGIPTITVSPNVFSGADIRPSRYVPAWWSMYPPSQRDMQWLYDLGYEDALSWCIREGFPGSEDIVVPTKGANYDGQWKTVIGQVVGYRWVEDTVLAAVGLLHLSKKTTTYNFLRVEMMIWKLVAVVAAALDRVSLFWAILASGTLLALVMLDQHHTFEFMLVLAAHTCVGLMKCKNAYTHVNSSEQWRVLQASVMAMEKHSGANEHAHPTYEHALTREQHDVLVESSFIYRMSSSFV